VERKFGNPRAFAAGDVKHGAIKRVASAVGEGATAIAFVCGQRIPAR
jgi:thioredoxin reductase